VSYVADRVAPEVRARETATVVNASLESVAFVLEIVCEVAPEPAFAVAVLAARAAV
jgi:hypothetical protein